MTKPYMSLITAIHCLPGLKLSTRDFIIKKIIENWEIQGRYTSIHDSYTIANKNNISYAGTDLCFLFDHNSTKEGRKFWMAVQCKLACKYLTALKTRGNKYNE